MRIRLSLLCTTLAACAPASAPSTQLFDHPWPDERLVEPDGTLRIADFPVGTGAPIRHQAAESLRRARGFGVASPVLFPLGGPIDATSLPTVEESASEDASVFVMNVDADSASLGERAVVDVRFVPDAGPFGGTNLLVALPYPGIVLARDTLHAAVVTTRVRAADGRPLPAASRVGDTPVHRSALATLAAEGVETAEIAALAVFRTDDPTRDLRSAVAHALSHDAPSLPAPVLVEEHPDYCVFATTVEMPVYQAGEPPYLHDGGGWVWADDDHLVVQRHAESRVYVTVPRTRSQRHPSALFVRAGGGGDRPLIDRGPRAEPGGSSPPGSGIARDLARVGYVGLTVDGPLGGLRNRTGWDEQTAVFNLVNPIAMRDNVRQSALELVLFAHALDTLLIDASACAGASPSVRVDTSPVLIAHSTGATIAPLAAAASWRFDAIVLSGAGASWIRQLVHKESPAPLRPLAEILFEYWPRRTLHEHDPMLGLLQWAGEPADPMVYAPDLRDRDVLVFQGVLDTYIPPPIANPMALSLRLDAAGPMLDADIATRSLERDLALVGRERRSLPARRDESGRLRVVTHFSEDGIEDGHEVLFQRSDARRRLSRFLASLADGAPVVE